MATRTPRPSSLAFPGGGQILYQYSKGSGGLSWVTSDGTTERLAPGFLGAQLFPSGTRLLAWRIVVESDDYSVMDLNGSNRLHVAGPKNQHSTHPSVVEEIAVSNSGEVAYTVDRYVGPGHLDRELYVEDRGSARTTDLGPLGVVSAPAYGSGVVAWDSDILLVRDPSGRAVDWVSLTANPGSREPYIRITDPRVLRAYGVAQPDAGAPRHIAPLESTPGPNFQGFAVLVSGTSGSDPAVIVFTNAHTFGFAARGGHDISFQWARQGSRFLLTARRIVHHGQSATIYVGDARTGRLRRVVHVEGLDSGPILNPSGTEMLYQTKQHGFPWVFMALTKPGVPSFTISRPPGYPWAWA